MSWFLFLQPFQLLTIKENSISLAVNTVSSLMQKLIELAWEIFPRIFWAISIIVVTRLAIIWVSNLTRKSLLRIAPTLRKFIIQAVEILTLVVGGVAALNALGIKATSVVAVLGAAGLAIGLSWQHTLSHFAAGIMLISLRAFEVGDTIECAGVGGVVDAIGIFSTTIVTADNVKVTIPNGQLFNSVLKNTTAMRTRRVDLEINIGDRPIGPTINLLLEIARSHPLVLAQPAPTCLVASITKETILSLRPWCAANVYEEVRSQIQQQVKEAFSKEKSEAPKIFLE